MSKNTKIISWSIGIFIILVVSVFLFNYLFIKQKTNITNSSDLTSKISTPTNNQANEDQSQTIQAVFNCRDSKTIQAIFHNGTDSFVDLNLSDERILRVPRAMSASGARYATENEQFVFWNQGDNAFIEENGLTTFADCSVTVDRNLEPVSTIANPASLNCQEKGGQLQIMTKPDGSQYGLCYFDDNRACEEWAMMRGDCPVGGIKTTGYDTDAQRFCVCSGGRTIAIEQAVCTFSDGSTCLADDFYAGTCHPGENR